MYYIIYGPEGSGKSTQARLLAKKLKIPLISSGDLVRKTAKEDQGFIGKTCLRALEKGYYVPNTEMFVLFKRKLKEPDVQKAWVLDGFPRNLEQISFLERKLHKYSHKINKIFYLKVSDKECIKRLLKRKRRLPNGELHDTPERIKGRLKSYKKSQKPILNYFKEAKLLEIIDGERPIKVIFKDILASLE